MDSQPYIKTVSTKTVYQNRWMKIHEDATLTNNTAGIYGYLESPDGVEIVAVDNDGRLCMIYSFRYPSQSWGWEFPAGSSDGEDIVQATHRELQEETGIMAGEIEELGSTLVCNGFMTERQHTYIAYNLQLGGERTDTTEPISDVKFFTGEEIERMLNTGEIDDNQTITALFLAKRWLTDKANQTKYKESRRK